MVSFVFSIVVNRTIVSVFIRVVAVVVFSLVVGDIVVSVAISLFVTDMSVVSIDVLFFAIVIA